MLVGDLIETNAYADSHGSKSVEYEYKVGRHDQTSTSYELSYKGVLEVKTVGRSENKTNTLDKSIQKETKDGWVLHSIARDRDIFVIFKRVKQ